VYRITNISLRNVSVKNFSIAIHKPFNSYNTYTKMKKSLKNLSCLQEKNTAFQPLPMEQIKYLVGGYGDDVSNKVGSSCRETGSGSTRMCVSSCCD